MPLLVPALEICVSLIIIRPDWFSTRELMAKGPPIKFKLDWWTYQAWSWLGESYPINSTAPDWFRFLPVLLVLELWDRMLLPRVCWLIVLYGTRLANQVTDICPLKDFSQQPA